jgi:uncharacterized repeat protein (TIGR03803 family)
MRIGQSRRNRFLARLFALGVGALLAVTLAQRGTAAADQETVLYSFCAQARCTDGYYPVAGLIMDKAGNLYGTTEHGGAWNGDYGSGTVFELTPPAAGKTAWTHKVLYSFCAQVNCADGSYPAAGLIMDKAGNLYGTTFQGGAHYGFGTVFELTPPAAGKTAWTQKVLYSFCAQTNCTDGSYPAAGLIMDKAGNLYGTTEVGGVHWDFHVSRGGTVFELTPPAAAKTAWTQKVLYSFCAQAGCTDGREPEAGLIMDTAGNLYGTTYFGGSTNHSGRRAGVVFELTPNAAKTAWTETVTYSFCFKPNYCADGSRPFAGLIMDALGNLYGTTQYGGLHGQGAVFELTP